MAGVYGFSLAHQSTASSGAPTPNFPLAAQLSVKVYDSSGALKASVTQNDDMVMNNFMNFLASWMTNEGYTSAPSTFTMTDTTGTVDTLVGRDSLSTYTTCTWACEISSAPYAGGYIAVGTGTTAVARTDHKLTTQYQSLVTVTQPTYDPSTGQHRLRRRDHRRVGREHIRGRVLRELVHRRHESWANFLMFHDTFTAVPVSAGNTISIQYTVQLGSTAYNNNLGTLLAAIFANPLGTASSVMLTPTSGHCAVRLGLCPLYPIQRMSVHRHLRRPEGRPRLWHHRLGLRDKGGDRHGLDLPQQPRRVRPVPERSQPLPAGPDLHGR